MISTVLFFTFITLVSSKPIYTEKKKCKASELQEFDYSFLQSGDFKIEKKKQNMLIDVKFFVFHDGNKGKISEYRIGNQVNVLNEAFGGKQHSLGVNSKIKFRLKEIQYIENKKFYSSCGYSESEIIKKYSGNTKKYISVYVCNDDYLGYAYYPWHGEEGDIDQVVFLNGIALTGSNLKLYDIGLTLVHELGHFFGLPHTFNDNRKCSSSGDDGFTDTPIEKTPNYGCNLNRDTCPNHSGKDPIWNYMDYTEDKCMNRFTKQQVNSIIYNIDYYRPKLKSNSVKNYFKTTTSSTKTTLTTKTTQTSITTKTSQTTQTTTTTKTSNTAETSSTTTKTITTKNMYKSCAKKDYDKCKDSKKCYWHDHYIECYPKSHEDDIKIFCDVRKNDKPNKTSKSKCKKDKYKKKCKWNEKKKKCVPRKK